MRGVAFRVLVESFEEPVEVETVEEWDFREAVEVVESMAIDTATSESFFGACWSKATRATISAKILGVTGEVHRHQKTTSAMSFGRRRRPATGIQLYSEFRGCSPNLEKDVLAAKEVENAEIASSYETTGKEVRPPRFERGASRSTVDCSTSLS